MGKIRGLSELWAIFLLLIALETFSVGSTACSSSSSRDVRPECGEGGTTNHYCYRKRSSNCNEIQLTVHPRKCYDTQDQALEENVCLVDKLEKEDGCGDVTPSLIMAPEDSLVDIRLYYHFGVWKAEGLLNLTFPPKTWKELKLQYSLSGSDYVKCRKLSLLESVTTTLMHDCHFATRLNASQNVKFTVQSDSGQGASYLFKIPQGFKINPQETCPADWHVFFYIHLDALNSYEPLPITIQSSPYGQVMYNVVLAKCTDASDKKCRDFEKADEKNVTKDTTDDLWNIYLQAINTGGTYTVRVQMVSDWCPRNGCNVSVSPTFKIASSPLWIVLLAVTCIAILCVASFLVMLHQRRITNKDLLEAMESSRQPSVLLAYHPESRAAMDFVDILAEFLMKTCFVTPLMADRVVLIENPSDWTRSRMADDIPVLFIIPKDSEAPSITSIRGQWKAALTQCISADLAATHHRTKRLAKLVLPLSGTVPCEIKDIRRFELRHNPAALATWLHAGSFLDQVCLWLPHIKSSAKKNAMSWKDVEAAAEKIGSQRYDDSLAPATPSTPEISLDMDHQPVSACEAAEDSDASDDDFDPQIPNVPRESSPENKSLPEIEDSEEETESIYE